MGADGDARIGKMKDGRTHLAHKAEHAVDMDMGAIVAVTLQAADQGDTTTLDETLCEAGEQVAEQIRREAESKCAVTYRRRSRKDGASGKASVPSSRRCTRTGDGCGASTARAYCDGAAS
jgi:hypothetical protein